MGKTKITAPPGVPYIDMEREFDAPRELVHRAYLDPELVVQWLGPRKYRMEIDRWDARAKPVKRLGWSRADAISCGTDDEQAPGVPDSKALQSCRARQYSGHDA